jgi:hypothetical protein
MTITTIGRNQYRATFNRRHIQIANEKAVDLSTGEIITGDEARSIRRLVEWHIKTRRDSNELPTLWTVRQ